ncbi:FH2 domain-containing protein 1-like [Nerophis ophidion]|uniref:FH2 domain-containing protein 1-like n=1 Tax=Nerophis ophidion TaxID=159077 RepID=UPI002ADFB229|nr:FH2 domain-containing protein 1-like [Nerophis ophidion]XP_061733881.1 FH2 domain-containing protein 1-like [Nerophis ophidion]
MAKMQPGGPPAPPPPLLPPPPPPPPLALGSKALRRRSRMRNFNWETIPKHSVMGKHNIWTEDQADGDYQLDTHHMEELFSHKQAQQHHANHRHGVRGAPVAAPGGELVSILGSKRSMNIGIFLKQFRRPVADMIDDIGAGSGLAFGCGKLRELLKLLPDEEEVKQLLDFKGDQSALPDADLFMLMLVQIPSYEERVSSLVLKEEFLPFMTEMRGFIDTLKAAGNELLECDSLHSVIRLVLKMGNYMNAGGYAGSAVGFRMASLLKLVDTKANKPGMNLMHYVVMQAQKVDTDLLNFPDQLQHMRAAARINKSEIEAEFARRVKKVREAQANTLKQDNLKAQMEDFLKDAEACLAQVEQDLQELQSSSDSVAQYFCEDPDKFRLEECCSVFDSFCEKFLRAMQENKAREVAEVKRRHKNRLMSAAKRRSTATCSTRDKEMDGIALESVLQSFLTSRISRRRSVRPSSTYGSPVGGSPQTGSLSEIPPTENLPALRRTESLKAGGMAKKEWNSAAELTGRSDKKAEDGGSDTEADVGSEKDGEEEKRTGRGSSSARCFSADLDEEDLQDNNQEEAQKLREASRKVLLYQSSRGSVSSGEFNVDNPSSPPAVTAVPAPRRLPFDMESDRYPGDPTDEDLVRFLFNSPHTSKRNMGRRHTLPIKVKNEEEDEVWDPNPDAQEEEEKAGRVQDSTETLPQQLSPGQDQEHVQDEQNGGHVPHRSSWNKSGSSGVFFGFLKRLGDIGRLQAGKDGSQKGFGTDV